MDKLTKRIEHWDSWTLIGELNKILVGIKVPEESGLYVFTVSGASSKIAPPNASEVVVYIGRATNLRKRLNDYIADRKSALGPLSHQKKVRSGIKMMFREYHKHLNVYICTRPEIDLLIIEDIMIKIYDPIFNQQQKISFEIPESEEVIVGRIQPEEPLVESGDSSQYINISASFEEAVSAF